MARTRRTAHRTTTSPHGTLTRYVIGKCRCDNCRSTAVRYSKELRIDRHRGNKRLIDAAPIRAHVASLQQQGMSFRAIAIAAGWTSRNALATALESKQVRPQTARRILAVTPNSDTRPTGYTTAIGSQRRLQALAALGHSSRTLAVALGHNDTSLILRIQSGKATTVRRATAHAVADLYDTWWNQPGTSPRTRNIAQKRGWLPPMAWDDDTIDNPDAEPDPTAVRSTHQQNRIQIDDLKELLAWGHTRDQAAERLGVTRDAIDKTLSRAKTTNPTSSEQKTA